MGGIAVGDTISWAEACAVYKDEREPPLDTLPPECQALIKSFSGASGAPESFIMASILAQGSMMMRECRLRVKGGYYEYSSIWVALVGKPGTVKTAAITTGCRPTLDIEKQASESYAMAKALVQNEIANGASPKEVVWPERRPAVVNGAGTIEGIFNEQGKLYEQNRSPQVLVYRDELPSILALDQHKANGGDSVEKLLQQWQGAEIPIVLKSGVSYVPAARCTMIGGIQPQVFDNRMPDEGNGFLDRFLFVVDHVGTVKMDLYSDISDEVFERYNQQMEDVRTKQEEDGQDRVRRTEYEIDDDAREVLQNYIDWAAQKGEEYQTTAHKKWERNLLKLSLIYAGMWGKDSVDAETATRASRMMKFLAVQWLRAHHIRDAGMHDDEEAELEKYILMSLKKTVDRELYLRVFKKRRRLTDDRELSGEVLRCMVAKKLIHYVTKNDGKTYIKLGAANEA